jgi:hypothetical protein
MNTSVILLVVFVLIYFLLQIYILPKMGIST